MRHARLDYEGIQSWPTKRPHIGRTAAGLIVMGDEAEQLLEAGELWPVIPVDEPVMVFRAKDPLASIVVDFYADQLMHVGADKEMVDLVVRWAAEMRGYRDAHYPGTLDRVPDVDKGFIRQAGR